MTIVVSEETGAVSLAVEGTLYRNVDADFLRSKLKFAAKVSGETESLMEKIRRRVKNAAKANKAGHK